MGTKLYVTTTSVGGTRRLVAAGWFTLVDDACARPRAVGSWLVPNNGFDRFFKAIEFDDGNGPTLFLGTRSGLTTGGGLDITTFGCKDLLRGRHERRRVHARARCEWCRKRDGRERLLAHGLRRRSAAASSTTAPAACRARGAAARAGSASGFRARACRWRPREGRSEPDGALSRLEPWRSTQPAALGQPFVPGETVAGWYRDPAAPLGSNGRDRLHDRAVTGP
jgi:hypothetical protein